MAKKVKTERTVESVMKPYELMLILSPNLRESDVKKKLKEITDMIEKAGGKITHEDFWGKKQLAYRIKKCDEGIYMVYNLELPNIFLAEFKQHLRIEKDVLRTMLITLPADHTYTKYDLEAPTKEKPKREKPKKAEKPKEKIEEAPVKEEKEVEEKIEEVVEKSEKPEKSKKKEETPEESEEPKEEKEEEEAEEKVEEPEKEEKELSDKEEEKKRESELDRKLDELLGGDDLKL